jgi:IPT/TIG domain
MLLGILSRIGDRRAKRWKAFFDLAGLQVPSGGSAQYQVIVEAVDPHWSPGVGPYSPGPVSPSGSAQPVTVTVTAGGDVEQNILMRGSAQPLPQAASSWSSPSNLLPGGNWISTFAGFDDVSYFLLPAQANRMFSVAVTALDESDHATLLKTQPVIGVWGASDPPGTVPGAFTPSPFNQLTAGMTRLDAQVLSSGNLIVGIADVRGDGRPDYHYHAQVLYADTVSPARIGISGGAIKVQGTGFAPGFATTIGNVAASQLAVSAGQMILSAPASPDGQQNITITDPVSGASTTMTGVLTYGAAATDNIVLLYGLNPGTSVGTQATNPVSLRVMAADGVTPVSGATIGWSANNGLQLSACGGGASCSVTSDQNGDAVTWLTPGAPGLASLTATLAPGVYSPAKSVTTSLNATEGVL